MIGAFLLRCAYEVAKLILVMACLAPFILALLAVATLP